MKKILSIILLSFGMFLYAASASAVLMVVELRFDDAASAGGPANPGSLLDTIEDFDGNTDSRGLLFEGMPHAISGHDTEVQCGVVDKAGGCHVTQNSEGLGVRRLLFDQSATDNFNGDEFLAFSFNQPLWLIGIDFENVGRNDDATLAVVDNPADFVYPTVTGNIMDLGVCNTDSAHLGSGKVEDGSGPPSDGRECQVSFFHLGAPPVVVNEDQWLIIGTPAGGFNDDFRIESLWVAKDVPEPTTLLLLGAGLVAIGFPRRRRGKEK